MIVKTGIVETKDVVKTDYSYLGFMTSFIIANYFYHYKSIY